MKVLYLIKILLIFYAIVFLGNILAIYLNIIVYLPDYFTKNSINIFNFYTNQDKIFQLRPVLYGYSIWFLVSGIPIFSAFLPIVYYFWQRGLKILIAIMFLAQAIFFSQMLKSFDDNDAVLFLFTISPVIISFFSAVYIQSRMQQVLAVPSIK